MAYLHAIRLRDEADTTPSNAIYLTADGIYLGAPYVPRSPDISEQEAIDPMRDGGELVIATRRNVTDSIPLLVTGATADLARAELNEVEKMLVAAEAYQQYHLGSRKLIEVQWGATGAWYRSELMSGRVELGAEATRMGYVEAAFEAVMAFKRRFYWEAVTEVELPLANGSVGSPTTGGVVVYNHDDSGTGHDNWVIIAAADAAGALPAPIALYMETVGADNYVNDTYIGEACGVNSVGLTQEAESALYDFVTAVDHNDATCSGGVYTTFTLGATRAQLCCWLKSVDKNARYFHAFARLKNAAAAGTHLQLVVESNYASDADIVYTASEVILAGTEILVDLGLIKLPPWNGNDLAFTNIYTALFGYVAGGGTLDLDCIELLPMDRHRSLLGKSTLPTWIDRIVDDGPNRLTWVAGNTAAKYMLHNSYGEYAIVYPGQDNKLCFVFLDGDGAWTIDRQATIKAYYRPRRLTL